MGSVMLDSQTLSNTKKLVPETGIQNQCQNKILLVRSFSAQILAQFLIVGIQNQPSLSHAM